VHEIKRFYIAKQWNCNEIVLNVVMIDRLSNDALSILVAFAAYDRSSLHHC
jgi:hypothetical protein